MVNLDKMALAGSGQFSYSSQTNRDFEVVKMIFINARKIGTTIKECV